MDSIQLHSYDIAIPNADLTFDDDINIKAVIPLSLGDVQVLRYEICELPTWDHSGRSKDI